MLTNPDAAAKQIEAINARAGLFSWDDIADNVWRFYQQVLDLPPRSLEGAIFAGHPGSPSVKGLHKTVAGKRRVSASQEKILKAWQRRISFGIRVWREEGAQSLRREIRRYIRWWLAKF